MKKIVATAAVIAALVSPASAVDDTKFQDEVMKCWNVPATDGPIPNIVWNVEIDGRGAPIDITATTPKPPEGIGRAFVESLKRAVARCAPYRFPAGVYKITIDKNTFGGKSLDPYK